MDFTEFIGFAAQAKFVVFESAGASALHALIFGLNPGGAKDRSLLGRSVYFIMSPIHCLAVVYPSIEALIVLTPPRTWCRIT